MMIAVVVASGSLEVPPALTMFASTKSSLWLKLLGKNLKTEN